MSNDVKLTRTEAIAILTVLKSMTYEGLTSEEALRFQATLFNFGERIEESVQGSEDDQYELWVALGSPSWENTAAREKTAA